MSFIEASSTGIRERSVATIMGQVLSLVGAAIGLCALGSYLGQDLAFGTARLLSFVGLGMLIAQNFVRPLRYGPLGIGWLAATAAVIGFGLGPVLQWYVNTDPGTLTSALGITTLTVVGMGAAGFAWSKDLIGWMRPLSYIVLGAVVISLGALIFGGLGSLSPFISIIILLASAGLIMVDFNYVRKHATEDDVVWLATGIFVAVLNIFLSLLNIFSSR